MRADAIDELFLRVGAASQRHKKITIFALTRSELSE